MSAAVKMDEMLYDSLESLSLPDVYIRLREVMDSDNASMADAAEVISLDPALVLWSPARSSKRPCSI